MVGQGIDPSGPFVSLPSSNARPSNVVRFEQLWYLSLGIGVIQSMPQWNRLRADARAVGGAAFVLFIQISVFAMTVFVIWLIARRRKNWAR
jgi:preprotein translocase subunit SecY